MTFLKGGVKEEEGAEAKASIKHMSSDEIWSLEVPSPRNLKAPSS